MFKSNKNRVHKKPKLEWCSSASEEDLTVDLGESSEGEHFEGPSADSLDPQLQGLLDRLGDTINTLRENKYSPTQPQDTLPPLEAVMRLFMYLCSEPADLVELETPSLSKTSLSEDTSLVTKESNPLSGLSLICSMPLEPPELSPLQTCLRTSPPELKRVSRPLIPIQRSVGTSTLTSVGTWQDRMLQMSLSRPIIPQSNVSNGPSKSTSKSDSMTPMEEHSSI